MYIDEQVKTLIQRVLIVDDEADFRRLVKEALPSFIVVEAGDGKEALELVQEEELDLVITDIRMPNMDGFGLLDNLRSQYPQLPVLAVSGYLEADEARERDFDGFVDKPISLQQLRDLVEQIVAQQQSDGAS